MKRYTIVALCCYVIYYVGKTVGEVTYYLLH